jgi:hypothetical protein
MRSVQAGACVLACVRAALRNTLRLLAEIIAKYFCSVLQKRMGMGVGGGCNIGEAWTLIHDKHTSSIRNLEI